MCNACNHRSLWPRLRSLGCSIWAMGWLRRPLAWKCPLRAPKGGVTLQKAWLPQMAYSARIGRQIWIHVGGRKNQSGQGEWCWVRQPKKTPPRRPKWASFSPVLSCGCVGGCCVARLAMTITSAHIPATVWNARYVMFMIHIWMQEIIHCHWLLVVVDLAGAQELTQYLVWDEDGEEEVEDTVTSSLFEAVDRDRDDKEKTGKDGKKPPVVKKTKKKKAGKKGKKKAKKSKGRKRKSTSSSSTSSESEQDSSSSSSSVTWTHISFQVYIRVCMIDMHHACIAWENTYAVDSSCLPNMFTIWRSFLVAGVDFTSKDVMKRSFTWEK